MEGLQRRPHDPSLRVAYARLLARRGKLDEAEAALVDLQQQWPGDEVAARALGGIRAARILKDEGNGHYQRGEHERAAASYTEALQVDPEKCMAPILLGNRAQARLAANRPQEATADCDAAIQMDAENVKLRLRRAACHVALKHPEKVLPPLRPLMAADGR